MTTPKSLANNAFGDVTSSTDALNYTTNFGYDANRNQTSVTDALSHVTTNTFDLEDQLTTVTRHDATTIKSGYDNNGNVVTQTDPLNHTTTYAFDALDRPVSVTDPLGRITRHTYDPAGNLIASIDAAGKAKTLAYDAGDQLVSIAYADASAPDVAYSYDTNGRRATMADGSGTSTYAYDSLGRLIATVDGTARAVAYGYDLVGHLTSIAYPTEATSPLGRRVERSFDDAGRMTKVSDWATNTHYFGYDANSNLISQTVKVAGVSVATDTWSPDAADRTMGVVATTPVAGTVLNLPYSRDATDKVTAEGPKAFGYDTIDRVTSEGSASFGYDAADRLTALRATTQSYDVADQLISAGPNSFSHDQRGNRTSRSGPSPMAYGYDGANRLITSGPSTTATTSYGYNGDGLRTTKVSLAAGATPALATSYTWDLAQGLPLLLQENLAGLLSTSYIYGPSGLPLEQISATGQVSFFHHDQLGSTRALTNAAGVVVATATYDAYGKPTTTTGIVTTPFGFAGQYTDAETGFQYLRARYYDPGTGQFLTRDPIEALTRSAYGYVGGNPLNGTDPSGLFCIFSNSKGCIGLGEIWDDASEFIDDVGLVASHVAAISATAAAACAAGVVTAVCSLPFAVIAGVAGGTSTVAALISTLDTCVTKGFDSIDCARSAGLLSFSLATFGFGQGLAAEIRAFLSVMDSFVSSSTSIASGRRCPI